MTGFFTRKEVESQTRPDGKTYSCISCGLYRTPGLHNPKIQAFGNMKQGIMNIGEAPGEVEDQRGQPWQGKTGRLLKRAYADIGVDLFEDCININAANCRPTEAGSNRAPNNYEIDCCRRIVLKAIREYKPKAIVLLGKSAVYSLLAHRWKKDLGKVSKWRGWQIPDQDFQSWICPTFHPSYVERSDRDSVTRRIWKQDLQMAVNQSRVPFRISPEPTIDFITDLSVLNKIHDPVVIDYETTGIKPHATGHRIVIVSVATSPDHAYVFVMPKTKAERKPFLDLLANPGIAKRAHNMKYEEHWSAVKLRQPVENWEWDSMVAAHILDNRPDISSLTFQTYVHFGVIDYTSDVDQYLKPPNKETKLHGANALNEILTALEDPIALGRLMKYCGLDTIYTYRLSMLQRAEILLSF